MDVLETYLETWLKDDKGHYITDYLFPSSYAGSSKPIRRVSLARSIADCTPTETSRRPLRTFSGMPFT